jgi:hypothetical protein
VEVSHERSRELHCCARLGRSDRYDIEISGGVSKLTVDAR